MHFQRTLLLLVGATSTLASPVPPIQQSSPLVLPPSSLPQPDTLNPPVQLKQVVLGLGHQNYTCDSSGTATAIGATAALFDAKPLLQKYPYLAPYLPGTLLGLVGLGRDTVTSGVSSAALDNKDYRMSLPQLGIAPVGYHYFNSADKLPVFTFPGWKASIVARKVGGTAALGEAMQGPDGQAAVDWLLLGESGLGKSFGGLSNVYRVHTAGGSGSGVCAGVGAGSVVRVPYAAEYWFYG